MRAILGALMFSALLINSSEDKQKASVIPEVHQLYLEDQQDRGVGPGTSLPWNQIEPRDTARRARVHELLESGELKTAEDFCDAAFIYQHGQKPEDYLLGHVLAMVAVQKGDVKSLWISAATLDRYLQKSGQPQIFGTQYSNHGNSLFTQEPYNRDLIPDQLRLVYCVPGLEQQKKNVAEFDAGKYPSGNYPSGMHSLVMNRGFCSRVPAMFVVLCVCCVLGYSQAGHSAAIQGSPQNESQQSTNNSDPKGEQELRVGTALTGHGEFEQAIPHLLAARGHVANEYAASVNLVICYIATNQPNSAIPILNDLRSSGTDNADVNNLLAQSYIGNGDNQQALQALKRAVSFTPTNEKLYMFIADACMTKQTYTLGMQVVDLGLKNLPNSARLHFERAMFLSLVDRFDEAKGDFDLTRKLAPDSNVAFNAGAQEAMFDGNVSEAIRLAREGAKGADADFMLLTLLGDALLRSGAAPGQAEFEEARTALEKAIAERGNYPSSQLALGKLYLLDNRLNEAIVHLEIARQLDPGNASVYSNLAAAYRKQGDLPKAQDAIASLAKLNKARAEKIRSAPGDRRAGYAGVELENGK